MNTKRIQLLLATILSVAAVGPVRAANTGTPPFFQEVFSFSLQDYWCENHLSVADVDGDGRQDIVLMATALASPSGPPWSYISRAILLHAEADGTFTDSIITNFPGRYGYGAVTADLNNDDAPDLILREQSATHVLLNDGHGAFHEVWTGQPGYYNLAVVDVNHDGFLDIVSGTQSGSGGLIELFTNNGTGTSFAKTWQSRLYGSSISTVLSLNLNNDGELDIAARETYTGLLVTLHGTQSGDSFVEQNVIALGDRTFALAGGRVNADAVADVAAYVGWGRVRVFLNQGNGSMADYWQSPDLGQAAFNLALADFDQDGFDDIFVGTFSDGALRIYQNNPGVGFDLWWQGSIPGDGYTGSVADLNGDGYPDLIVGERDRIRIFVNAFRMPLFISNVTVTEGNTGSTNAVFTVSLATNHSQIVSVDFTTVDGSATAANDYLATSGTLIFNPGETNKTITVPVLGETLDEADEIFFVRLSNPTNISLFKTQAVGTILNDDTVPLSITGATVLEGNSGTTNALFALHLARPHVLPVSVDFATASGTAVAGADYIATSGTVTFAPGETNKSITVLVNGDVLDETNKTFFVTLSNPLHAVLTSAQAAGTILDDDTVPLSITGATVLEGNTGTTNAVFTLHLARPHILPVSVDFTTANGGAVAGADYIATNGTVTFAPDETNKSITVLVNGDWVNENNETFFVNLSHPVHASLTSTHASGTILDDETGVLYVNLNNPTPVAPYTSWATAAINIQDAIDAAADGDEVVVTNGVYQTGGRRAIGSLTNRVSVTNALMVRSVNGPEVTVIEGFQNNYPATQSQVRCVFLTNGAALSGFTLTNGAGRHIYFIFTNGNTIPVFRVLGGGVWCASPGSVVSNCIITANGGGAVGGTLNNCTLVGNWGDNGGGASDCTLNNCTLTGNSAVYGGGGAAFSTLNNCVLTGNSATNGGGAFGCVLNNCTLSGNSASFDDHFDDESGGGGGAHSSTLNNCTLTGNSATNSGGGAFECMLTNCTLIGNSAAYGGGAFECTLNNSTLTGNFADDGDDEGSGGGAYESTLNNCTLTGNSAVEEGGGAADSTLNNCTLTGNSADYGGGVGDCELNNCIVYYNTATTGLGPNHHYSTLNYSCTTPMPSTGAGNITNEPVFIDLPGGNLRLASNSPCINAGNNAYAPAGLDLGGNPRIVGSTVDVGAYEFQSPWSLISYAWLHQYGLPINSATDSADPDGDRLNNYQEWRAGTDPTKPLSVLRLITVAPDGSGGCFVRFTGGASRSYQLQRATNVAGPWTSITTATAPASELIEFHDTNAPPGSAFYRTAAVP